MQKQTTLIIAVALAAIIFGVLGYWVGVNKGNDNSATVIEGTPTVEEEGSVTATPSASGSTTADATANWKTYTNTNYKISFKYPADWTISEKKFVNNGDSILTATSPATAKKIADKANNPFTDEDISIKFSSISATPKTVSSNTIGVWLTDKFANHITAKNAKDEIVNGIQFTGVEMQADPSYYAMFAQGDNGLFALDFGADAKTKSDLSSEVSQIVSTFQFTN